MATEPRGNPGGTRGNPWHCVFLTLLFSLPRGPFSSDSCFFLPTLHPSGFWLLSFPSLPLSFLKLFPPFLAPAPFIIWLFSHWVRCGPFSRCPTGSWRLRRHWRRRGRLFPAAVFPVTLGLMAASPPFLFASPALTSASRTPLRDPTLFFHESCMAAVSPFTFAAPTFSPPCAVRRGRLGSREGRLFGSAVQDGVAAAPALPWLRWVTRGSPS